MGHNYYKYEMRWEERSGQGKDYAEVLNWLLPLETADI